MNRSILALLTILLLTGLSLNLTGCHKPKESEVEIVEGPIKGWTDIAIPENATWETSSIGGTVENHYFAVENMSAEELFTFLSEAMALNGWTLNLSNNEIRQFIKEGHTVTFNENGVANNVLTFVVIIEPKGVYEDDE